MRGSTELISWDNGIKQYKVWLHRVWSLPEVLFLHQRTLTEDDYLDYKAPRALLSILVGMEDAHRAVGLRTEGWEWHIMKGKLPAQGIQTVLCSHCCAICHVLYPVTKYSTRWHGQKKPCEPPKSWSLIITPGAHPPPQKEPSSAPSDLPGTHCRQLILYLKNQARITGAGFSAFTAT